MFQFFVLLLLLEILLQFCEFFISTLWIDTMLVNNNREKIERKREERDGEWISSNFLFSFSFCYFVQEPNDGMVCVCDAILPGSMSVVLGL